MHPTTARLRLMWQGFCRRLDAKGDPEAGFNLLQEHYNEPHRAYHTFEHIFECLHELSLNYGHEPKIFLPVEAALWFHDIIYDVRRTDNEELSAKLAASTLIKMGQSAEFAEEVAELIVWTKHLDNKVPEDYYWAQLVLDIDLAKLGKPAPEFIDYERKIRREYDWVPENVFFENRARILRLFLNRPRIYLTSRFFKRYEKQARENLTAAIERCKNKL